LKNTVSEELDSEELLHLALLASKQNKHEESISLLKRAQNKAPKEGKIYYLLGAEHAQIGLYDRAADEMTKAIALDPLLHTASFQLGLLHITSGRIEEATQAWQALDNLGSENPLFLFKTGMLHLARDEFEKCATLLKKGMGLNNTNESLNHDMQRILVDVEKHISTMKTPEGKSPANKPSESAAKHVLLSAYSQNKDDETD
jgi:Flp pilus assembly protein TadD